MMRLICGLILVAQLSWATTEVVATTETAAVTERLAEDQIPLKMETVKKASEAQSSSGKALFSLLIVTALLVTGFYGVKRYRISNSINKSNTKIKVVSQHYLGPKKSLAIIHVAGESMLIGVTDQNISMIKSLSLIDDEIPESVPNHFGQALAKTEAAESKSTGALPPNGATAAKPLADAYELDEEFSFSNVTETVSKKIKSMRSIS